MADEDQIVCFCFRVTQKEIVDAIQKYNLQTPDQVTRAIRAGGGCRTCRFDIEPLIAQYADKSKPPPEETELNEIQIYNRVYKILEDATLQKELQLKGVRLSLENVEEQTLFFHFHTLQPQEILPKTEVASWLEGIFRKKLHPRIQVIAT